MVKNNGPISPDEVAQTKKEVFPPEVFEAFNELIAENEAGGHASFDQDEVVARMVEKGLNPDEIYKKGWLNVKSVYEKEGWRVTLDRPGYDETYSTVYDFKKHSKKKS